MIILASSSPRRRELLSRAGVPFRVIPSEVDEGLPEVGERPEAYALRLAREKAESVARRHPGDVVLAADTVVAVDDEILGKPTDREDAIRMLLLLRGRSHVVATGVAVCCADGRWADVEIAYVSMRGYSLDEVEAYVATGEPMDKAGAYGVQGLGGALVEEVDGCYNAVVGLPLSLSLELLRLCGVMGVGERGISN